MADRNDLVIDEFLKSIENIKEQILRIYFFGSRTRDDFTPNSDYDLLLVVIEKKTELINKLYDIVIDILLSTGGSISLKIFKEDEFKRLSSIPTPFMKKILAEGKIIG